MKNASAQVVLVSIFLLSLAVQAGILLWLLSQYYLAWKEAGPLLESLLRTYSVPLTVVLSGIFADRQAAKGRASAPAFWIAFAVCSLWNLLLVVPALIYSFAKESVSGPYMVKTLLDNSKSYEFLVAGALTYFFAARNASSHEHQA